MRHGVSDVVFAFPAVLIAILITSVFGASALPTFVAVTVYVTVPPGVSAPA